MDLFNRVGKGVKAAKNGVVGGVGKVGSGVGKVGKGVGQGVVGGVKGVGSGVATVGKGVGSGVATVGKGVGNGVVGVGAGVVGVGTVVGKTAVGGVTTVGKGAVGAAGAVGGTAMHIGKTVSGRGNSPKRRSGLEHRMEIYCSDFYTEEFVLEEIEKARNDKAVVTLHFEDMILRECPEITQAATKLLLDTAASYEDMLSESGRLDSSSSHRSGTRTSASKKKSATPDKFAGIRRSYESVTFTECVSDAMDYQRYLEEKEIFSQDLLGRQKIRANVPMRFIVKVELHTMMPGEDVKEVLKEIEKDESITGVDFPNFNKDHKKVPNIFMENFDPKTGEWKEDAMSIAIELRYGGEDNMAFAIQEDQVTPQKKNPRKVITRCIRRLEGGADDTEGIPKNSKRGEREGRTRRPTNKDGVKKRASEGTPKKKKGLPRKTVSEGAPTTTKLSEGAISKPSKEAPATITEEGGEPVKRSPKKKSSKSKSPKPKSNPDDESFSWNEDNDVLTAELGGLTKSDAPTRKSSSKKKKSSFPAQPMRAQQ